MADDLLIDGKTYVVSRAAAKATGYTQDYIGQLARGGHIDARRIGGLWHVDMQSLAKYKEKADAYTPLPPHSQRTHDTENPIVFEGKEYIAASAGAEITGYHQDYVAQLARTHKVKSRQIGNRWYVEREALLVHKSEKDALLAAVQTESVGLASKPERPENAYNPPELMTYLAETHDLLPQTLAPRVGAAQDQRISNQIPIKVHYTPTESHFETPRVAMRDTEDTKTGGRVYTVSAAVVATILLMLSYGMYSIKDSSIYAVRADGFVHTLQAGAAAASETFASTIHKIISNDLVYIRE